jgi:hypothetical protein
VALAQCSHSVDIANTGGYLNFIGAFAASLTGEGRVDLCPAGRLEEWR